LDVKGAGAVVFVPATFQLPAIAIGAALRETPVALNGRPRLR